LRVCLLPVREESGKKGIKDNQRSCSFILPSEEVSPFLLPVHDSRSEWLSRAKFTASRAQ
jgi:hypothetical protein